MATDKETTAAVTASKTVATTVLTIFSHAFGLVSGAFKAEVPKLEADAEDVARELGEQLIPNPEARNFVMGLLGIVEQTAFTDLSVPAQVAVHVGAAKAKNLLQSL